MKVILPVAGKGTRLRPHTLTKPKSLVRVAGKTVLQHVIDGLKKLEEKELSSGKDMEYIIITDENGQTIQNFMKDHYPEKNVAYKVQTELLGPAHAVYLASSEVKDGDDVLVVFNDTLFVTDLTRIPILCEGLDGLIYSKEVEDYKRFGVNVMKGDIIADMVEKPDTPISKLAQVGMYYLKDGRNFMNYIERSIKENRRVKGEFYLPEVFKLMIEDGFKLGAPEIEEWLDCGKPETLLQTNKYLLERATGNHIFIEGCVIIPPVAIHPTAEIHHSVIGPYVTVAEHCKIHNSVISNSVINPNSVLNNTMLDESLIGDAVILTGQQQKMNIGDNSIIDLNGR